MGGDDTGISQAALEADLKAKSPEKALSKAALRKMRRGAVGASYVKSDELKAVERGVELC